MSSEISINLKIKTKNEIIVIGFLFVSLFNIKKSITDWLISCRKTCTVILLSLSRILLAYLRK